MTLQFASDGNTLTRVTTGWMNNLGVFAKQILTQQYPVFFGLGRFFLIVQLQQKFFRGVFSNSQPFGLACIFGDSCVSTSKIRDRLELYELNCFVNDGHNFLNVDAGRRCSYVVASRVVAPNRLAAAGEQVQIAGPVHRTLVDDQVA